MQLKIGVNLTHLTSGSSGAKTCFINLFSEILKNDLDNKYFFFLPKKLKNNEISFLYKKNSFVVFTNIPQQLTPGRLSFLRFCKILLFFKKYFKNNKINIFIHTSLPLIKNPHGITISNIFDIRYLNKSFENNFFKRLIYNFILTICLKNSEYILTISNFIKKEIINKFNINKNKIKIFYCTIKKQKKFLIERKDFILTVGHFEERKNFFNLLKSFYILKKKYNYPGNLKIVSNSFPKNNKIMNYIKEKNMQNFIQIEKNISNIQLQKYYASAQLFVFPSIYEGFGLPILEALEQNCRVLTSKIDVFREILGNNYQYFNPYSPEDMAQKIFTMLKTKNIKYQKKFNKIILNRFNSHKNSISFLNFLKTIT
jgi:glycosyltransferase involved in cell wall biosynthesis